MILSNWILHFINFTIGQIKLILIMSHAKLWTINYSFIAHTFVSVISDTIRVCKEIWVSSNPEKYNFQMPVIKKLFKSECYVFKNTLHFTEMTHHYQAHKILDQNIIFNDIIF